MDLIRWTASFRDVCPPVILPRMRSSDLQRLTRSIPCLIVLFLGSVVSTPLADPSDGGSPHNNFATEVLAELIPIRTTVDHSEETVRALKAMATRLTDAGFAPTDIVVVQPESDCAALVARYRGNGESGNGPLLLMAHIDVVPADPANWEFDPFSFSERSGYYHGRGSSDNKAGVATLIANFVRLRREGFTPDRDLIVVLTGDEEVGGDAISYLMRERRDLIDAELALNADAGGGEYGPDGKPHVFYVQTSEKVYQSYRLTATSPGGHSALPTPDNAIYSLAAALARLADHRFPFRLNEDTRLYLQRTAAFADERKAADMIAVTEHEIDLEAAGRLASSSLHLNSQMRTTCVATQLEGGQAENALPQSASAVINCRILPGEAPDAVKAELRRVIGDETITVEKLWDDLPSPPTRISAELMRILEDLVDSMWPDTPVIPRMSAGASDALFVRNGNIPVLGVAGYFRDPDDDRAHGPNERIGIKEFHEGVEFWYRMLKRLSSSTESSSAPN